MKVKSKEKFGTKEETYTLKDMVENKAYSYDSGSVEIASSKASESISFTEKLVELLYKKGLLNDKDIASLVASVDYVDEDSVSVVSAS